MKKVLLFVSAAVIMSACAESPTAPAATKKAPAAASHDDLFCESGYVIAFDENGNPICVPDGGGDQARSSLPRTGGNSSSGTGTPPGGL
jgi:hypothetical protein